MKNYIISLVSFYEVVYQLRLLHKSVEFEALVTKLKGGSPQYTVRLMRSDGATKVYIFKEGDIICFDDDRDPYIIK